MRIYHWPADHPPEGRRLVAVGGFDGLHLGHRRVAAELCRRAREQGLQSCLVTFEPLPAQVFASVPPHNRRLTTYAERLRLLQHFCLDEVCILDFTQERLQRLTARQFLQQVLRDVLGAAGLCGSHSHRMGSDRVAWRDLTAMATELGMEAIVVEPVRVRGEQPSSTHIRQLVWAGEMSKANKMLGRDYAVTGVSVPGQGRGRTLGFPTANLEVPPEKLLPTEGVYAGWATGEVLGDGPLEVPGVGPAWPAAMNVGTCPTIKGEANVTLEVHVIGWDGTTYGHELTVGVTERLRGEQCFEDVESLRSQIAVDVARARLLGIRRYAGKRAFTHEAPPDG
ncbi:MAG: bifunctional riboflavin kinase/FMN adenylyltransferase [Armatimonadetes bacterium]|nr:bifunctional riboflavin kinase/FMN adenylyltransferase [Armatimonadota bacterium]